MLRLDQGARVAWTDWKVASVCQPVGVRFDVCFRRWFSGVPGVGRQALWLWWSVIKSWLFVMMFDRMSWDCFRFFCCRAVGG